MNDDELLSRVAGVVASESPPDDLIQLAKSSMEWMDVDTVLMELVEDSASDELVTVRDETVERFIVFEDAEGIADMVIRGHDPSSIEGRVDVPAKVRIERPNGDVRILTEEDTMSFEVDGIAPGPIRLVLDRGELGEARSDWITI